MLAQQVFQKSRAVVLVSHRESWAGEFSEIARRICAAAGPAILRIDHIGSTAVPDLCAKDVIDIQITVADLDDVTGLTHPLWQAGFRQGAFEYDVYHALPEHSDELRKLYLREPLGGRRTHIHVREAGRFNARFALLFRDYLRAYAPARQEYELLKSRAATVFPDSIEGYLFLKEPVFHLIYQAAECWAEKVRWKAAPELS
ncbi:GrpB family protein [Hymenobacter properus]|uniref:GrpB family protein n=1 Tax=Hymenobacter properus TaxID=2791026 RepID=A0A931FJZ2_9BACT|nr:GrpB family protein [Hymenobacter properus]MBF9140491.1 GrpB family protein [Hymenobacter properus]MBR7719298.1 GrpB family protein [Microvirga sp. SRT04]